jgi:hypothetical protein
MAGDRLRVQAYYAVWAALCASVGGSVVAVLHTLFFSAHGDAAAFVRTLGGDVATALALGAGQGVIAFLAAAALAALGRGLRYTVLLGLVIGVFDLGMYLLQMTVPATELGWGPDLAILAMATVLVTVAGVAPARVTASGG